MSSTTVAIPLYAANRWVDVVERNARELAPHARVVLSDANEADAALAELRDRLRDVQGVEFRGARDIAPGWVSHCNDLHANARTPFFMWLPQDDEVDAGWVLEAQDALRANKSAVAACGHIAWHFTDASPLLAQDPVAILPMNGDFAARDVVDRLAAGLAVAASPDASSLGMLFRGVQRRAASPRLPVREDDSWTDILWALELLARGPVLATGAEYRKRRYPGSTHEAWAPLSETAGLRSVLLLESIAQLDPQDAVAALSRAWEADAGAVALREKESRDQADALRDLVAALEGQAAQLQSSRSWRVTRPLRALRRR